MPLAARRLCKTDYTGAPPTSYCLKKAALAPLWAGHDEKENPMAGRPAKVWVYVGARAGTGKPPEAKKLVVQRRVRAN